MRTAKTSKKREWDIKKGDPIEFFDINLSYEASGYIPINATSALDFDPSWFTEARETYKRTGHYTSFKRGSKGYRDFWTLQYKYCKYGMTVNGYTITGDHYYFLNYYLLKDLMDIQEAGGGRKTIFPAFMVGQYEWFHYLKLAKILRSNALMMKSREAGFSEIEAGVIVNSYNCIRGSVNVAVAHSDLFLSKLLEKVWGNMSFINDNTDGGFFKSRGVIDTEWKKRASQYKMVNGQRIEIGWKSQVQGIITNIPDKLRGDRTDLIIFEEAGSFPRLTETYTKADALVGQIGRQHGIRIAGGTGGDSGPNVEGLRRMYYNPTVYGILPFRHNYTQTGELTISGFFIPAFKTIKDMTLLDKRGWISEEDGKAYFQRVRDLKAQDPKDLVLYCAEYCFTAEEAFSLEGDNKFNKVNIAEQLTRIRAFKEGPKIEKGFLEYLYKNNIHTESNITGFKFIPSHKSHLQIIEHPLWELSEQKDHEGNTISARTEKVRNLYVIGIDGIDIGLSLTSSYTTSASDFCCVVYKRAFGIQDPSVVALYKDRPDDVREAYKIAIKLALYYNATINIEATRQGILSYAREKKLMNLFMRRPLATMTNLRRTNTSLYGTPATPAIIAHQTDLIADYVNDYCHMIWFDEMLDELNRYTDENKRLFDIIAAFAMALLADEELQGVVPKKTEDVSNEWLDFGYYTDEYGHRRYGIIPKTGHNLPNFTFNPYYEDLGPRTSNPRLY